MQQIRALFDIGNSNVKMALASSDVLLDKARPLRCADLDEEHLLAAFSSFLARHGLTPVDLAGALLCSVVPEKEELIKKALNPRLSVPIFTVPREHAVPLKIYYQPVQALGSDRLVEAYAARRLYAAQKLVVVDLGTAITIDCLQDETFLGGLILPGPALARLSLARATAQLPEVRFPENLKPFSPGQNTEACIQTGLFFGLRSLVRGLVEESRNYLGGQATVIGTGGFAPYVQDLFDEVREDLVLEGLCLLS